MSAPLDRRALLARLAAWSATGLLGRGAAAQAPPPRPPAPPTAPRPPATPEPAAPAPAPGPRPGGPAPRALVQELSGALARVVERFEARDVEGVLAHVSDQYWTGPFTKPTVRAQLVTMFQVNQQVRARVRIDEVRLVHGQAWVYSTGDVSGQLAVVGQWLGLFVWERELEVARRENGVWRLYGYQQ